MYTLTSGLDPNLPIEVLEFANQEEPEIDRTQVHWDRLAVPTPRSRESRFRDRSFQGVRSRSAFSALTGDLPTNSLFDDDTLPYDAATPGVPLQIPGLELWTVDAHSYSTEAALSVGLFGRLFGGDAKRVRAGVVHQAKRFTRRIKPDGKFIELGVAVRVFAATDNWDSSVQISLPNIAADAQLKRRDARVSIEVVGYSGALGRLLPAPEPLNVTTFAKYLGAFEVIQAEVFSEAGLGFIKPTLLGYGNDAPDNSSETASQDAKSGTSAHPPLVG